jgi:hypothetical protein
MNRTVLIVICDFLLLTLIATVRLDQPPTLSSAPVNRLELRSPDRDLNAGSAPARSSASSGRTGDVLQAMKSSLEEERTSREKLAAMLSGVENALRAEQQLAAERQKQLTNAVQNLLSKEEEARRLEQARAALARQHSEAQTNLSQFQLQLAATSAEARMSQERLTAVEQQYASAQTNLLQMEKQLSSTSTEARLARERLAQIEADLRSRQTEAEQARQRIEQVEQLRLTAEIERERIAGQLKVTETEQRFTQEQLQAAKGQIQTVQKEKAELQKVATELAEGVVQFSESQRELTSEIRDNRALSAHTIFAEFVTNRVSTDFRANRSGILGRTVSKDSQTRTILISDGTQTFAIYHVQDTPFRFEEFGKDWERFVVHLYRKGVILPLEKIFFLSNDPRVVVAPVTEAQAGKLGAKIYKVVPDPYKFEDVVLIGADEGYYGECRFAVDPQNRGYLRMDRSVLGRLVGKFNPSRGDLVFSKSGDLVGIMVNKQYCALLTSFVPTATIPTGTQLNADAIGTRLSRMDQEVRQLPLDLQ